MFRNKDFGAGLADGPSTTPTRKERGNVPRPFLTYISIMLNSDLPTLTSFAIYFPHQFINLRGKSPERGLDETFGRAVWKAHSPSGYRLAKALARDIIQLKWQPVRKSQKRQGWYLTS